MKYKAFSLIELMVVIAIVAVLAAIAIPAYKTYMIKVKTTQIVNVIESLSKQSVRFSQTNGYFPNAYELGLSTTPGEDTVADPSAFFSSDLMQGVDAGIQFADYSNPDPCGKVGLVGVTVDAYALGIPEATAPGQSIVAFVHHIYHVDDVINTLNYYYIVIGASTYIGGVDYVPGWMNMILADNTTTNPLLTDRFDFVNANATCM